MPFMNSGLDSAAVDRPSPAPLAQLVANVGRGGANFARARHVTLVGKHVPGQETVTDGGQGEHFYC
jgi:hypothetical protein